MKALKSFEFPKGARSVYDWDKLLDGTIYEVIKGEDYECNDLTFRMMSYKNAKSRGKVVQVARNSEGTGLVLKASPASPQQIAAWEAEKTKREASHANGVEETVEEVEEVVAPAPKPGKTKAKSR